MVYYQQRYLSGRAKVKHPKDVKRKRKLKNRKFHQGTVINFNVHKTIRKVKPSLGDNIKYIVSTKRILLKKGQCKNSILKIPKEFSLSQNPTDSFQFIFKLFSTIYHDTVSKIEIDYRDCEEIDLDAQVFMDVILQDFVHYLNRCYKSSFKIKLREIKPINYDKDHISKILFSIGSFNILKNVKIDFPQIIPYHLCVGNKKMKGTAREVSSQKEIHTTKLIDYVKGSLNRMGRELTPDALSDLCQVVGEVLINAEEHSTTSKRYSIGFFEDRKEDNKYGVFNLVIFNFGQTIYEKFKDPSCPTKHIVKRMEELSSQYTKKGFFTKPDFAEESLWTLYSLQDGVTSKDNYKKRGNGSIRFIESFINLKGAGLFKDPISSMRIFSGNTRIIFEGTYQVKMGDNNCKIITFNNSGKIEDKPDKNFVNFADHYFPGTMIAAKILIQEEDLL